MRKLYNDANVTWVASGFSAFHNGQTTLCFCSWPPPTSFSFVFMSQHLNQQSSLKDKSLSYDTIEYFLRTLGIVSFQYLNHTFIKYIACILVNCVWHRRHQYMVKRSLLCKHNHITYLLNNSAAFFAIFANSELKLSAPSCVFLSLFSTCGTNPDHAWPESTYSHTLEYVIYPLSYTHCTHTSLVHTLTHYTVYTSLPSASSTSPQWLPVCASTWHASGPTGRSQFPLMANTGGSTWTALSHSSCLMVRLNFTLQ